MRQCVSPVISKAAVGMRDGDALGWEHSFAVANMRELDLRFGQ